MHFDPAEQSYMHDGEYCTVLSVIYKTDAAFSKMIHV
jgi:hypothetical protein